MIRLPLSWVEWMASKSLFRRPRYLCLDVAEAPLADDLQPNLVFREVRNGHLKWAHLACPKCDDHIQLPISGAKLTWSIKIDWLRRPTLRPSIWERSACGAHFFVRRGEIVWC